MPRALRPPSSRVRKAQRRGDGSAARRRRFSRLDLPAMARTYLTQREYDALLKRQNGMCCLPWCENTGDLIAEHSTPNALFPAKPDQLMCKPCHKLKTLRDVKAIAKAKRLNGVTMSQYARRKKFGSSLKGRGFDKRG